MRLRAGDPAATRAIGSLELRRGLRAAKLELRPEAELDLGTGRNRPRLRNYLVESSITGRHQLAYNERQQPTTATVIGDPSVWANGYALEILRGRALEYGRCSAMRWAQPGASCCLFAQGHDCLGRKVLFHGGDAARPPDADPLEHRTLDVPCWARDEAASGTVCLRQLQAWRQQPGADEARLCWRALDVQLLCPQLRIAAAAGEAGGLYSRSTA